MTTISHPEPAKILRGIHRTASPTTPPRPDGSGQLAGAGMSEAKPEVAIAPAISSSTRGEMRPMRRSTTSRQPQAAGGASAAAEPTPRNCMSRSAEIAPPRPSQLCGAAEVAWVRLGSSTDHDISDRPAPTTSASKATPAASAARRFGPSRRRSGRWSSSVKVVVRIQRPRAAAEAQAPTLTLGRAG